MRELDGVDGHRVRGLGAGGARGQRRRRLQLLGRAPAPDALAGLDGIWELFLPGVGPGARYKFEILTADGELRLKADPFAPRPSCRRKTASVVFQLAPQLERGRRRVAGAGARERSRSTQPISIYEVHLGSWRLNPLEDNRSLTYLELADELSRVRRTTWASPTSSCCR